MNAEPQVIEQTFPAADGGKLVVENIRGSVVIRSGNADKIHVAAVVDVSSGDVQAMHIEVLQELDGTVRASARMRENMHPGNFTRPCKVTFDITTPLRCDVDVDVVSSNASLQGLHGQVSVHTVSGSLTIAELEGSLDLHTVSGDMRGRALSGPLNLRTVSGSVRLQDSYLTQMDASTVSGDLVLETPLMTGPYKVNSVSGDLRLMVPQETGCEVEMSSFSGDLAIDFSAIYHKRNQRNKQVTIGAGGPLVQMNSMSGDLRLHPPKQTQPENHVNGGTAHTNAAAPAAPSRLDILDKIASGEMSVEEGIRLIEQGEG